jgi:hypothetical protein
MAEIPNPKHEIRNKFKTQSKNVQNEESHSYEREHRCLVGPFRGVVNDGACPGHPWCSVATVLVIWVFGLGFVSDFGF